MRALYSLISAKSTRQAHFYLSYKVFGCIIAFLYTIQHLPYFNVNWLFTDKFTIEIGIQQAKRQGGGECPDQGPCEASVLASVFCELSTARSEDGARFCRVAVRPSRS